MKGGVSFLSKSLIETLKISAPSKMDYTVFYSTPKDQRKFLEQCKRMIRSSQEYKDYIAYLKENMDLSKCAFFPNLSGDEKKVKVEIHHDIFTLEDITSIIINKHLDEGRELNVFDISDEVMECHYKNMVCLVPLSRTLHKLAHSEGDNRLIIPLQLTYGNYAKFIQEYYDYMDDSMKGKIEEKIEQSSNLTEEDFKMLSVKYQYLEVEGMENPDHVEVDNSTSNVA